MVGKSPIESPGFCFGVLTEQSAGKDTTTGHREIAGAPVLEPFSTFERFPDDIVAETESAAGVSFIGNYAQSGTVILEELGEEHSPFRKTNLYTSADSVIQIAAHKEIIPLDTLYDICRACRGIADRERIGRVIARPFLGIPGQFSRTSNRHDVSVIPPETVLNRLIENEVQTTGVGKISDIFADSGIDASHPTRSNAKGIATMYRLLLETPTTPRLIFSNLVDFDMLYGHRRDPIGYANALEEFDRWLGTLIPRLDDDLFVIITADHGNDSIWHGTDHTRERVPLLVHRQGSPENLGLRDSFADIAASLSEWFGINHAGLVGKSFI